MLAYAIMAAVRSQANAGAETTGKTLTYGFAPGHGRDLLYRLHGLPVAAIAASLSRLQTVPRYFYRWIREGRWEAIHHKLVILSREQGGRDATSSVGISDSQSAKTSKNGGPRGYDTSKKIKGRKRHIATDTLGHVVATVVHSADVQDRDGAPLVATRLRSLFR